MTKFFINLARNGISNPRRFFCAKNAELAASFFDLKQFADNWESRLASASCIKQPRSDGVGLSQIQGISMQIALPSLPNLNILNCPSVELKLFSTGEHYAETTIPHDTPFGDIYNGAILCVLLQAGITKNTLIYTHNLFNNLERNEQDLDQSSIERSSVISENFYNLWSLLYRNGLNAFKQRYTAKACLVSPENALTLSEYLAEKESSLALPEVQETRNNIQLG